MHVKRLSSLSLSSSSSHFSVRETRGSSLTLAQSMERLRRDNRWKMLILVSQWRWKEKYRKFVYVGLTRENAVESCFLLIESFIFHLLPFIILSYIPIVINQSFFILTTLSNWSLIAIFILCTILRVFSANNEYFFLLDNTLIYCTEMWNNNEKVNVYIDD